MRVVGRRAILAALLCGCAAPATRPAVQSPPRLAALCRDPAAVGDPAIVAIGSDYRHRSDWPPLPNLEGTPEDGRTMQCLLSGSGLRVRSGGEGQEVSAGELRDLHRDAGPGGGVLYFSGHCQSSRQGLLIQPATAPDLPFSDLTGGLGNWLFVLNCCHSGIAALAAGEGGPQWLLAAGNEQIPAGRTGSAFTIALAFGVESGIADENCDGVVTVGEAAGYADALFATGLLDPLGLHRPLWKRTHTGDRILARLGPETVRWSARRCQRWVAVRSALEGCMIGGASSRCADLDADLANRLRTALSGGDSTPLTEPILVLVGSPQLGGLLGQLASAARAAGDRAVTIAANDAPTRDLARWLPTVLRRFARVLVVTATALPGGGASLDAVDAEEADVVCRTFIAHPAAPRPFDDLLDCLQRRWSGVSAERIVPLPDAEGRLSYDLVVRFRGRIFAKLELSGVSDRCPAHLVVRPDPALVEPCAARLGHCVRLGVDPGCGEALREAYAIGLREARP